jgi:hypothetical protein
MTDSTFNISFVVAKTGTFTLEWTSTETDLRPTFSLTNVPTPSPGDEFSLFFDSTEYTKTITYGHIYDTWTPFTDVPELVNDTWAVYMVYTPLVGSPVTSNTVNVTINVAYSAPVLSGTPTIEIENGGFGDTFTVTPSAFTGRPIATSTYQWKRDGVAISAATGLTYDRTAADNGKTITCTQTVTNSEGSDTDTSTGIYVPIPGYAHLGMAAEDGGFDNTHAKTVDFGTYTGTKTALIMCQSAWTGANISTLAISGHTVTAITVSGADTTMGVWTVPIVDGGSRTLTFTGSAGPSELLITWGLLEDSIDPAPATALRDSGSGTGQVQLVMLPGTTVLTDGVQIALTSRFCLDTGEGIPPFENAAREGYANLEGGNAYGHVCSSSFNLRMKQNRDNGTGAWSYIGLIFDPL